MHLPTVSAGAWLLPGLMRFCCEGEPMYIAPQCLKHLCLVLSFFCFAVRLGTLSRILCHVFGQIFRRRIEQSHQHCRALLPHERNRRSPVVSVCFRKVLFYVKQARPRWPEPPEPHYRLSGSTRVSCVEPDVPCMMPTWSSRLIKAESCCAIQVTGDDLQHGRTNHNVRRK